MPFENILNMINIRTNLLLILSVFSFLSCSKDPIDDGGDGGGSTTDKSVNEWIEATMRDYYYWYNEIPDSKNLNFNAEPENFFYSLLTKKDGKIGVDRHNYYSRIESTSSPLRSVASAGEFSMGFEYAYYLLSQYQVRALQVLYVIPGSPAARSELKRGDWIFTIDGNPVSDAAITKLFSGSEVNLGIGPEAKPEVAKQIKLKAESIDDNPVYIYQMINYNNRKIGYLMYNHFTSGKNSNDETYNNLLRQVFTEFKKNAPQDFILDLRYNMGGAVNCAQLLATFLAPSEALGKVFCNITYNDKKKSLDRTLLFDTKYMSQGGAGENLNLSRLFVITSDRTASASEAVINGLEPFMGDNLIMIGDRTEGKNVGSITLSDDKYSWELHPIVCKVSNVNKYSDYENGFLPTFECVERYSDLKELGSTDEYILNSVLEFITTGKPIRSLRSAGIADEPVLINSSLDRKKTNGVIIPAE